MTSKARIIQISVSVLAAIVFLVSFKMVLSSYEQERENRFTTIVEEKDVNPDHINIKGKVTGVDPIKGEMKVRLEFDPVGKLKAADNYNLAQEINVMVYSAVGKKEFQFKKGKHMDPFEVTLDLYDGEATDYPYDQYNAELSLEVTTPKGGAKPADTTPAPPPAASSDEPKPAPTEPAAAPVNSDGDPDIPITLQIEASVTGLKLDTSNTPVPDAGYIEASFKIARSRTVFFFSTFVTIAMWCITLIVVSLLLIVTIGGRKIEIGMFSFMSSLLFAFPALRNAQPGTPPIGSYSDHICFFWTETIVAVCLLTLIITWLVRPAK